MSVVFQRQRRQASWTFAGSAVSLLALLVACSDSTPVEGTEPGHASAFVRTSTCQECHADIHDAWQGTHHDRAMELANSKTVLADFDDTRFDTDVESLGFHHDGDRYFVSVTPAGGEATEHEVRYTFGVEPLQQYLVEFPGGRLQCLTVAWDVQAERWFSLYPGESIARDDPFHWTGRYQGWNVMCAACHSTALVKGYDQATDTYETTWEDLNVGCEACHGPGETHVAWARRGGGDDDPERGWASPLRRGDSVAQMDACAPCHSRRTPLVAEATPGSPFLDSYQPALLSPGLYHPDGQILEEVYVYGSFVQSQMHRQGVTCTDCHDAHSLDLVQEGNALCTQCHTPYAPLERFPSLTKKIYDGAEHHFHPEGSTGAACVACHMPERTYMVVDPRRDHSFRVPRPDLGVQLGVPDACTACHTDRTAEWAAETLVAWYGAPPAAPHFAEAFAAARSGDSDAGAALIRVAQDVELAGIVRGTAIEALAPYGVEGAGALIDGVTDDDALVRAAAARSLESFPPQERAAVLAQLLTDEVRLVRLEAARALSSVPVEALPPDVRADLKRALDEYRAAQHEGADMPWAHLNLGRLATVVGEPAAAEAAYVHALKLDAGFLPARFNLANLLNASGRNDEAERLLRAGIAISPAEGELHYSLGLLLAEMERGGAAADALSDAMRFLPERPRVHYNGGLALAAAGRHEEAAAGLHRAHQLLPDDLDTLYALATFYLDAGQPETARPFARRLAELVPEAPIAQEMLRRVEQGQAAH